MNARIRLISASLVSLLGVIGVTFAQGERAYVAGPACSAEGSEAQAPLLEEDARVYYIGCGGLY
jgi:hypothetical protein